MEQVKKLRRKTIAVVGFAHTAADDPCDLMAFNLGKALVEHGYRVVTGGLGGVMEEAMRGAHSAENYREGDTLAILPSFDRNTASPYADIVIATGMDVYRNGMIANSDAVVVIGGGAGTLSEIAYAWHLCRLIVAYRPAGGWGAKVADRRLDDRKRCEGEDLIFGVDNADEVLELLKTRLQDYSRTPPRISKEESNEKAYSD